MIKDRSVRRLTSLEQSASTARVLNLLSVHRRFRDDPEIAQAPFFQNRLLERSIILKHRVRPNETVYFSTPRSTVTKILVPIDPTDLKVGARFLFMGQTDFEESAATLFGEDLKQGARDRTILDLIDTLPSFDPFLLREHLRRHGIVPAQNYFGLSDADIAKMYEFVRQEIIALVSISGDSGQLSAARLVDKLLSTSPEGSFEPLKVTLKLSDQQYQDGIFCWRGFLYYKWVLSDLMGPIQQIIQEVLKLQPRGPRDPEAATYIAEARPRIVSSVTDISTSVQDMLAIYDRAYASLTQDGKPGAFRDFLLSAPAMFNDLGERLGAVQHVISFWRYRFPHGQPKMVSPGELMDLFLDFEDSLTVAPVANHTAKVA